MTAATANPIVWCHAGKPGTDSSRMDASESKVHRGSNGALQAMMAQPLPPGTRSGKLGKGVAVETQNSGDGFTTLSVTCGDKIGILHKVTSALNDAGLFIAAATVVTHKQSDEKLVTDKFKLTVLESNEPLPELQHAYLQQLLVSVLELSHSDNLPKLQVGAMEVGKLTFNNDVDEHFTVIDMEAKSRMGLLRDISYQLLALNLNIISFNLQSDLGSSIYSFSVATSEGKQLNQLLASTVERVLKDAHLHASMDGHMPRRMSRRASTSVEREEGGDNAVSTPTGPVLVEWTEPVSSPISQGKRWSLEEAATVAGHSGSMFPHCVYPGAQTRLRPLILTQTHSTHSISSQDFPATLSPTALQVALSDHVEKHDHPDIPNNHPSSFSLAPSGAEVVTTHEPNSTTNLSPHNEQQDRHVIRFMRLAVVPVALAVGFLLGKAA
eukprot:CAMPEP_0114255894 /NCGR_PEP_ID=MMETSP0058-20121206/17836_1 /TAXON_ID=36894 /ORGANISM="Pyramimonas parkeae, CCMP726" /LENGTH=438 /DNA_ID=CAMNT_0001370371 /DNA_START=51 /DNA_END=1367 /DNA_ORIENTATION=+